MLNPWPVVTSLLCLYQKMLVGMSSCSLQFLRVRLSCRVYLNSSNRMSSSSDDAELFGSILNCLH
jgi:hypothetical protein